MAKDYQEKKAYTGYDNDAQGKDLKKDPSWSNAPIESSSAEDDPRGFLVIEGDVTPPIRGQFQSDGMEQVEGANWEKSLHNQSALNPIRARSGPAAPGTGTWPTGRYDENTNSFTGTVAEKTSPESTKADGYFPGADDPYGKGYGG